MGVSGTQTVLEPGRSAPLLGQRVAFTGRLASLGRGEAHALVERAGGRTAGAVSARVTMLVVGMRGWPLMESGQLTAKLVAAERLRAAGTPVRIVSEIEFKEMLGLAAPSGTGTKSLRAEQVCRALGVEAEALRRWEYCGLVRSQDGRYDFADLVSLRTVTGLVARGVRPVVIRRSLDALRAYLPGVERPLSQLRILVSGSGELVAELEEALLTTTGQLELRFDAPERAGAEAPPALAMESASVGASWIEAGLAHERAGDLERAEEAYRKAAALAPGDAVAHFNLGNVLLARGRPEAAAERFEQAAALDPGHPGAWFNLAHAAEALGDPRAALAHLRRAVAADPSYADAYYNLGALAERMGEREGAACAWEAYVRLDPASEWGREARRRLRALRTG